MDSTQSSTQSNTTGTSYDTPANRTNLWNIGINSSVGEILERGSFASDMADVNLASKRPTDAIRTVLDGYQADGNPDAMVLIAGFARKEYLNPSVTRKDSHISGHSHR